MENPPKNSVPRGIDPRLVAFVDKGSPLSEQYRALRSNLMAARG